MQSLTPAAAREFAATWLPAWTGNQPEHLVSFYADDALYLDPGVPTGVQGRAALLEYFGKLLGYNPSWVWRQVEAIPLAEGFLNKWRATIPVGAEVLEVVGVCLVQLNSAGKIRRNEVYFDRSAWLELIRRQRASAG